MANFDDLKLWVLRALDHNGGEATVVQIARHIWENHEDELRTSGDMFFTWQYQMRWAGQNLQKEGKLVKQRSPRGWRITGR